MDMQVIHTYTNIHIYERKTITVILPVAQDSDIFLHDTKGTSEHSLFGDFVP